MQLCNAGLNNIILLADSYKSSHYLQYPPNTSHIYAYVESRQGEYDHTVFFGLQYLIKSYLLHPITQQYIDEAESIFVGHGLPFNRKGWEYILNKHRGFLPIRIKAVKEGSLIPLRNVLLTVENTDPKCFWLTCYIETLLLQTIWYPTTVATRSYFLRQLLNEYYQQTADGDGSAVDFMLHDFGQRGCSSMQTAAIGGLAHLVNFKGTDAVSALVYGREYYGEPMAGYSIPAAEHSTITAWGKEHEQDAYANMMKQFAGTGKMVAIVSDSYDIFNAVDNLYGGSLKETIKNNGGVIVVRPDSGDPTTIPIKVCEHLMQQFGYTRNSKGYRVLPNYLRVIQGDGITCESLPKLLANMKKAKLSLDNFVFGMGGGLTQMLNRDTQGFAMKCSAAQVDEQWRNVFKQPATDSGKRSKKGRLALVKDKSGIKTISLEKLNGQKDLLETVYENGQLVREQCFNAIRVLAKESIDMSFPPTRE